jgi:formate dehydrogenase assembly factor FdhD
VAAAASKLIQKAVASGEPVVASISALSCQAVATGEEDEAGPRGLPAGKPLKPFIVYSRKNRLSLPDADHVAYKI